jgi:hypothetical protein
MRAVKVICILLGFVTLPAAAIGQATVTAADITRLEDTAAEIERSAAALKASDPTLAATVERSLAELREEIAYVKVKLRREEPVSRAEYSALRDRLETLRVKADARKVSADPVVQDDPIARVYTVPVGTELDVRLQDPLNSGTAKPEQRFEATTVVDFLMRNELVIPAGAVVRGFVSSVRAAGRLDRRGSLTLSFDELRIGNRSFRMRATVIEALDGKVREDATRIGAGAVVGAIVGGILGGTKGALIGVIVGGGGTIAATEGTDVDLPAGTVLRIRLDQPLEIAMGALQGGLFRDTRRSDKMPRQEAARCRPSVHAC